MVTDVTDQYVRFETRNFIGGEVEWNEQDTNKGGYPDSDIRGYVDSTIWNLLPEDLRAVISEVDREWKDKDGKDYIIFRVALNPRDRVTASKGE